ncbi:MAG: porin family protein [Gammaproteobacteria bacterium]|nr:porin family protein [Gammaproteobacteria bacterium]MCW8841022.1 porin family protein [Gammaproteobacteria bacterium]MCW8958837.1 porin family protein [Gammaproteobacteria bacterium]MCW8972013.1 porin family protein [Gammaproteobacteria bacterium]MCW8991946.1 porin family protein [Gammaproteobacteria bacterium]
MKHGKIVIGCLVSTTLLWTGSVMAQGNDYVGIQYAELTASLNSDDEANPQVAVARFGKQNTDYLAFEARIATNIDTDSTTIAGVSTDFELDRLAGLYGVLRYPFADTASVYGVLGATHGKITKRVPGDSVSGDDEDISYGLGFDLSFAHNYSVNIEYMSYLDEKDIELTSLAVGLNYRF